MAFMQAMRSRNVDTEPRARPKRASKPSPVETAALHNNLTRPGRALRLVGGSALVGLSMVGNKPRTYRWAAGLAGLQMMWAGITGNDVVKKALTPARG